MSRTAPSRRELVAAIIAQGRNNSTSGILLHAAIAERLGLNPSDLKCADLMLSECEDCTPGRLAELTGLSTGAITGVIDRLERAKFLVREHDPLDRRRVLLRMTQQRAPEVEALFMPLSRGVERLCENFAVAELAVVLRFMREIHVVTKEAAEQLREPEGATAAIAPATRKLLARARKPGTPAARRTANAPVREPIRSK
jgi:DNA-binding MarR family transcriptional regulator